MNCVAALSPAAAWSLLGQKHDRKTLFLWDCEGQDLASCIKGIGSIRKGIPLKSDLGFFNVGTFSLKETKVLTKRIKGVFGERVPIEAFVSGVSRILEGDSRLPAEAASNERVAEKSAGRVSDGTDKALTPCEKRILALIREGKTNQQIAESLGIKTKSVKNYVYRLFQKIKVSNRCQAGLWANEKLYP